MREIKLSIMCMLNEWRIMLSNRDDMVMKNRAAFGQLKSLRVEVKSFALTLWSSIKEAGQRYWSSTH